MAQAPSHAAPGSKCADDGCCGECPDDAHWELPRPYGASMHSTQQQPHTAGESSRARPVGESESVAGGVLLSASPSRTPSTSAAFDALLGSIETQLSRAQIIGTPPSLLASDPQLRDARDVRAPPGVMLASHRNSLASPPIFSPVAAHSPYPTASQLVSGNGANASAAVVGADAKQQQQQYQK